MKKNPSPEEWAEEFREFTSAPEATPSALLSDQVINQVRSDLNPSPWFVFTKLTLVHVIVGTVILLFCPQFGVQLGSGSGLMGYLMNYGEDACMLGCGAIFLTGTVLTALLILRPEEIRTIRKTELLQISILSLVSLGVFGLFGQGVVPELALFWLIGSVSAGFVTLELGWKLRKAFV